MPLFEPRIRSETISGDDFSVANFLKSGESNDYVSAREALHNSDVYSIIFQLSNDLSNSNFIADVPKTQNLLNNPSNTANAHGFWQSMFAQLLLDGNAYAYRWRSKNGLDLYWQYLRPSQVEVQLLNDGSGLVYNINFDEPDLPRLEYVPSLDMIHFRLFSKNGGKTGVSPLSSLKDELKIKESNIKLTLTALGKAVLSPGVLKITKGGLLDSKQKANRSRQFINQVNNSNSGPIVLDDLENYSPLEMKADVASLLSQTDWTGNQIAKVYGVSDSLLNGTGDQQSSIDMIQGQYANALNRFEQSALSELNNKLKGNVQANVRGAIDPNSDVYASKLNDLTKNGVLAGNQTIFLLQQRGYIPENLPDPIFRNLKGGDKNDNQDSN